MILDPEGDDLFVAMHGLSNLDAAIGKLEFDERRRRLRESAEGRRRDEDEDRKKKVAKDSADQRGTYGEYSECPIPVARTLYVLVFVRAPTNRN